MAYNLTGYTVITGTSAAEVLTGSNAKNAIYGNGGADRLNGGLGMDVLFGGALGGVTFVYSVDATWGSGYRAVNSGDPQGTGPGTTFDLSGYGQSHDVFVGAGLSNTLVMGNGHNALFLDDAVAPGADAIRLVNIQRIELGTGGQMVDLTSSTVSYGNVTIVGNSGNDIILSNAGSDDLYGGDGADHIWGGSGNDRLFGQAGADTLLGGTGNDTLDGGLGADTMTGGTGNDIYVVDDMGDVVVEAANGGTDQVNASITYTLATNVENLVLIGAAAINGIGNTLNNTLTGNAANNRLDGGAGSDTMVGGAGDDTYVVNASSDVVTELAGEGRDRVETSVTYTLGANIEDITLTGSAAISGTGNALDNVLIGNGAANTLSGAAGNDTLNGGAGKDTMVGGLGNDTYFVDLVSDITTELAGEGIDAVYASVTHTLQTNVENLQLTGVAALNGTGNGLDNIITGNTAANVLSGLAGNDKIYGRAGADSIDGGLGNDQLYGDEGNDTLLGGDGNDGLNGGADMDTLRGGAGNDGLFGGGANDVLYGDAGNDNIYGDGGNDLIWGGAGSDLLAGGQLKNGVSVGNDTFLWLRADVINTAGVAQGFDHIIDFVVGDKVDLTGLGLGGNQTVFRVTDVSAGTTIAANFGAGFVDVVMLDNIHNVTLATLVSEGALLI